MPTGKTGGAFTLLPVLIAIVAGKGALDGQTTVGVTSGPAIQASYRHWPEVDLNVAAIDKRHPAQKIDPQTFQLFEDGTERPLHVTSAADSPVSLAFLIDSSGSIYTRQPEILSAVKTIAHALPAGSEVTFISFANVAYLEIPFTPVSTVDFTPLDRLNAAGGSALLDAVIATENHVLTNAKYARRALVILSDGEDNASQTTLAQAARGMERPGAPTVYLCIVGETRRSLGALGESRRGHRILKFLGKEGGGTVFNLDPDPASAASEIVEAIRNQYAFQFTAGDPTRSGKAHRLEVRLPLKDLQIYALPAYYPPNDDMP